MWRLSRPQHEDILRPQGVGGARRLRHGWNLGPRSDIMPCILRKRIGGGIMLGCIAERVLEDLAKSRDETSDTWIVTSVSQTKDQSRPCSEDRIDRICGYASLILNTVGPEAATPCVAFHACPSVASCMTDPISHTAGRATGCSARAIQLGHCSIVPDQTPTTEAPR
jgi:hypothetical protein